MTYVILVLVAFAFGWWIGRRDTVDIDYGFSTGRHWVSIGDKMIYQGSEADCNLPDHVVHKLGYDLIDKGQHWRKPGTLCECMQAFNCGKCFNTGVDPKL